MGGGYELTSVIKPSESRGYICWNGLPDVKYEINLLQQDSLGNYYSVGTKTTTNNYARLEKSNYTDESGLYFSIKALDSNNGSIVHESDIQTYIDGGYSNLLCKIDCNGSNYAWSLNIREVNNYGNNVMSFGIPLQYYDQNNDVAIYYYQAMSDATYNALPNTHPYKMATATSSNGTATTQPNGEPNFVYQQMSITNALLLGIAGPFYSASGNMIANGRLIQKKMNQFQYMGSYNALGNPDQNILCITNSNTPWINYFNTNLPQMNTPVSVEPFAYAVPTQLECDGGSLGVGNGGPDLTPYDLNNIVNTFNCNGLTFCDYFSCIGIECPSNTIGSVSNIVNGIVVEQFNDSSPSYSFDLKTQTTDFSILQNLPSGLYQVTAFGYNGEIYPFFFEHINPNYRPQEKDYVIMTLLPTLIENNQLNLTISSEINIEATVQVQSLDGTIHYTEDLNLKSTIDKPLEITINTSNIPYNQLKVNLIFSDGSLIQKTAVKVN